MSTTELSTLSALEKKLLKTGLRAHYREAADNVFGARDAGCFAVTTMMKEIVDRKERATRRAAAGRALARLIGRGFCKAVHAGLGV
jgi:hypothetical protein